MFVMKSKEMDFFGAIGMAMIVANHFANVEESLIDNITHEYECNLRQRHEDEATNSFE